MPRQARLDALGTLLLLRYIHLNSLRARLVKDISKLDRYCWCGHCVLMGRIKHEWQDQDYILSWFGEKEGKASADNVSIGTGLWNSLGRSSPPSGSFHVCYLQSP